MYIFILPFTAWIICYIIGFFLGKLWYNNYVPTYKLLQHFLFISAIILNTVQIFLEYVIKLDLTDNRKLFKLEFRFFNFAHITLGISLFLILYQLFSQLYQTSCPKIIKKVCDFSDEVSYDIYLVHMFLINGPCSLMKITPFLPANILLVITLTVLIAYCIHNLSQKIHQVIQI